MQLVLADQRRLPLTDIRLEGRTLRATHGPFDGYCVGIEIGKHVFPILHANGFTPGIERVVGTEFLSINGRELDTLHVSFHLDEGLKV